jgi:hypothetical protein
MSESDVDTDNLLNAIMPMVIQGLEKYGDFAPVGLAMKADGNITMVLASSDKGPGPPTTSGLMDVINAGFTKEARSGRYRSTALAYEAMVTPPGNDQKVDAIAIALDHRDGYSAVVYFPYRLEGTSVIVDEDGALAEEGKKAIFPR